ncbi:MAG: cytochrome c-type biogenesis protein CcmF [Bradymonadia bacterium]|jgi:cytochrome c-type biogenesis protein CcmF
MAILGSIALAVAFAAALLTCIFGTMGGQLQSRRYADLSRMSYFATTGAIIVASACLLYGFATNDFSLRYVAGRSDMRMPAQYVLAAFYGGQEGSLLFWLLMTSTFGAAASWVNRHRILHIMPWFHAVLAAVIAGLLFILVFVTPPFSSFHVINAPLDGEGLNPLLQNPLMVIHPPCLLSGFATFAIPYAFGMAALLARDLTPDWLRATRKWTLISWLFLSVGNILGGMWAYRELGWGGYWAWDPVENAAIIPWFAASAYLHSVIIQEQRGMFRKWNAILVALTFLLTIFGTWLTRSGLIQSVHTFAESDIGDYFLVLLVGLTAFSVWLIRSRWSMLESDHKLDSTVSREGAFLLNNWMFIGIGFVVLWGTLFPKLKEMVTGDEVSIGPAWFNQLTAPLALGLLVVMALGTLLPWRRTTLRALRRSFTIPSIATLLIVPTTGYAYYVLRAEPLGIQTFSTAVGMGIICYALIVFNLVTLTIEFVRGTRARMRATGADVFSAFSDLLGRHRRRYGGFVVHIGMIFIFLSFIGNVLKADLDTTLSIGDEATFGDYSVRFDSIEERDEIDKRETWATLFLYRDGEQVGTLHPSRFDFNDYAMLAGGRPDPMKVTSEIYIRSTPVEDVYVALLHYDPASGAAAFKLVVLPFTWWFWFGGVVLVAGTMIAMWPETDLVQRDYWRSRAARRLQVAALALIIVLPVITFGSVMEAWAQEAEQVAVDEHEGHDHAEDEREPYNGVLTPDQDRIARRAFELVMTTCGGCAGKSLALASPSCYPSNIDRANIRELVASGSSLDQVLNSFVEERGEVALAVPPNRGSNRFAWAIPLAGFSGGIMLLGVWVKRWTAASRLPAPQLADVVATDEADKAYFDQLDDELAERS